METARRETSDPYVRDTYLTYMYGPIARGAVVRAPCTCGFDCAHWGRGTRVGPGLRPGWIWVAGRGGALGGRAVRWKTC